MNDKIRFAEELARLRDEIPTLRAQPISGGELFLDWHGRVLQFLRRAFGSNSNEVQEFSTFQFELPPDAVEGLSRGISDAVEQIGLGAPLGLGPDADHYADGRLIEASDFLLALILRLRRS